MRFSERVAGLRRLRPLSSLFWQALAGTLAFLVPVSVVLLFLTVPDGPWQLVVVLDIIVIGAFLASYASYLTLGFWVGAEGIGERGFFGVKRFFDRDRIDSILLVNTVQGAGTEAVPQLFLCDADGKQLLRMRGQFWSLENMEIVADALDIPVTYVSDEVSTAELLEEHPGLLYWFERRPLLVAAAAAATVAIGAAAIWLAWSAASEL